MILDRVIQYLIGSADRLAGGLPSSAKRVVEKICDKVSAKLEEADRESLIFLDALEMLPVQDYQPRICFQLDDAVTVLKTIEHEDNQQLGNFS
jgi:hypothetical protein